jgi:hypothetical protein
VISFVRRLLHRPALQLGSLGRAPRSGQRLRNERFASYLASNNRRSLNTDRQDALLAGRRLVRGALMLGLVALAAWVVVESASAIGVF